MRAVQLDKVEMFVVKENKRSKQKQQHHCPAVWRIDARMKNGGSVPVVTRLHNEVAARFLARRLEALL
jgi:hypothetical protein